MPPPKKKKLPKGVRTIRQAAQARGRGGAVLAAGRRRIPNPESLIDEGYRERPAATSRGSRSVRLSPAASMRYEEIHGRQHIQGLKAKRELSKPVTAETPRVVVPKKKKLPKGVRTLSEAAQARGRGGQALRMQRAYKGPRIPVRGSTSTLPDSTPATRKGLRGERTLSRVESTVEGSRGLVREMRQRGALAKRYSRSQAEVRHGTRMRGLGRAAGKIMPAISLPSEYKEYRQMGGPSLSELIGRKKRRTPAVYRKQEM